ncbi:MAG TPA: response regulator transcription factor [Kofleriaceae bacterium]|nr:response regulator transcription factor [Kofleriaceae bacterium]
MRCLIVDDDESPRELLSLLITRSGHEAMAVASAGSALTALEERDFDVAIVDMEMPGAGGATTITTLRSRDPNLRVLVVSGHDDPGRVLAAFEAGADGYLLKDELSSALCASLHEVRAGLAPLSPRVAAIVLRELRRARASGAPAATALARLRPR